MGINQAMFDALQPGVAELNRQRGDKERADQEAKLKKYLQTQEPEIAGQKQTKQNEANMASLNDPRVQSLVNEGGSAKVGDISIGGNPYAKMAAQGPHQAQSFLKTAQGGYKGINDQLDAAQATIDSLNQGNAAADKVALINEARIAAGQGGSRAIAHLVDLLSGGQTAAGTFQDKLNWLQNTPNIPTLQPAQRDAIRETVFGRMPQLQQQHQQVSQQLMQQGPIVAPQADTGSLVNSFAMPIKQKLDHMGQMQQQYQSERQKMQPQPAIGQPATANANPTTFDRLKSFFNMGGGQSQQLQAGPQQEADPIAGELAKRAKQSLSQPGQ